jgi:hypothetical protein
VEDQPEKGYYLVEVKTTAPLRVADNFWGNELVTPQQVLDRKCPGAKVSEINVATWERCHCAQIVFVMPPNGCKDAGE